MEPGGYGVFMLRAISSITMALVLHLCMAGQVLAVPVQDEGDAPRPGRILNQHRIVTFCHVEQKPLRICLLNFHKLVHVVASF